MLSFSPLIVPPLTSMTELNNLSALSSTLIVSESDSRVAPEPTIKRFSCEFDLAEFVEAAVEKEKGNLDSSIFRFSDIFFVPLISIG